MSNCYTDQMLQTSDLGNSPVNTVNMVRVKWNAVQNASSSLGAVGEGTRERLVKKTEKKCPLFYS